MKKLTQSEWEIMDILWGADHPLSRSEILEHPGERGWKDSSLHILINSMLEKGAIQVAGYQKTGSHYGRIFAPAFTQSQYAVSQLRSMGIGERGKIRSSRISSAICWKGSIWMRILWRSWSRC